MANEPTTPERRRKRSASSGKTAQTRQAIIAAALDLFLENGFSRTRMIDVAERADVAKGTLYLYFADKETLFEGVLRDVIGPAAARLTMAGPPGDETLRDFLKRAIVPFLRDFESSRRADVVRIVISEGMRFPRLAQIYHATLLEPLLTAVSARTVHALERGELRSDTLVKYPMLLGSPAIIATLWNGLFAQGGKLDTAAVFESFLDLVLPEPGA